MRADACLPTEGSSALCGEVYSQRVRETFEGVLPLERRGTPLQGSAFVKAFGSGRIALMRGTPMTIHRKAGAGDATSASFNLFINVQGCLEMEHCARRSKLSSGDATFLDGSQTFSIDMSSDYAQILVQFPRDAIGRRHPELLRRAGVRFSFDHPAVQLLVQTASTLAAKSTSLDPIFQSYTYEAMLTLVGALQSSHPPHQHATGGHRFVRALADIDTRLSETGLSALTIANLQGIFRRRLDSIFAERGLSVERVIWTRRLERAATEIASSSTGARKLLDIALSCGFSGEAHFSRRFRSFFGVTPSEYRRAAAGGSLESNAHVRRSQE
jgi:AraC-like DNA-binding protein